MLEGRFHAEPRGEVHPFLKSSAGALRVYYTNRDLYDLDLRDVLRHDALYALGACGFIKDTNE